MSDRFRHLFGTLAAPWAITPEAFETICGIVERRADGIRLSGIELTELYAAQRDAYQARAERLSALMAAPAAQGRGVAVLSMYGAIAPRANLMTAISGGVSLERFADAFSALDADPTVGHIILDIDSPGGATDLVPETAALIRQAATPVTAVANTLAASAAYWLASQADEVVVTPSGFVGSIGVYAMHRDLSAAMEKDGEKVTFISAGPHKTEGNPYEPLSEEARAARQAQVDEIYGMFLDAVATGRGVSPEEVEANMGGGRTMTATQALAAGAVDRIEPLEATLARVLGGAPTPMFGRAEQIGVSSLEGPDVIDGEPLIPIDQGAEGEEPETEASSAQPAEGLGGAPKTPAADALTRSLELRRLRRRASGR